MESETTVEDESDLMSVISETTIGSINSPTMLNLLSRFKEPVSTDSIHRNSAASPSIPDQNFNLSTIEADFYKEAVGNLASEGDADNSQSLLSERCGSSDHRSTKDKDIASLKLGSSEYSHASLRINEEATSWDDNQVVSPKVEDIHDVEANNQLVDNEGNKAVGDTLADILTSLECDSVLRDNSLTPVQDLGASISCVKTGEIQLSPFTGFDSEIYPESVPVTTVPCETQCRKNSPVHRPKEKNCPDLLNIGNIHKAVQDGKSATKDDGDQLFERDFTTTTASEKYVNTLISSSVLRDVGLDDDTQAPISGDHLQELNMSANLETTNSLCPIESYVEQKDEQSICSEDCHQNAPKREDIHGVQDMQASSPQFSVVSDQSTEICRLDLRADTSDIACSQSNCIPMGIPMDFMTSGVTCGGDPGTTNHSSNNCSIETAGSNAKSSLQDDDKETKLQDPIDKSPNLHSIVVSNLQPDNFKEGRGSCNARSEQDLSPHKIIKVDEDNSKFQSLEITDRIEISSSPVMSCVSESILCTKNGKESYMTQTIQKQDYGISIQLIVDKPDIAKEGTERPIINEENMLMESEKESSPLDYNQTNEVKQTSVVLGSCIAVTPLTKGLSDDSQQSNNHKCKDLIIEERAMCIEYDNLSIEAKEGNEDPKGANGNSWTIRDISDSKIQASPTELKAREFSQPLNNPKTTYSPEKYEDMAGLNRKLETMPAPNQELLRNEDTQHQTMLTNTLIQASSELSYHVPEHSDSSKTDYTPEHLSKSNQSSRMSQNVSTCLPNSDTPKQLEPIRRLKPVEPGNFMDKSEHQEISKKNTQDHLSQSTSSYKSMIYSRNFQKSKTVVHENECSQQETPETAMRRSSRESKQPMRFSSPEQNIMSKLDRSESPNRKMMPIAKHNYKTGSKKQKIPITFTNTKIEGRGEKQDYFGDDFEVHQEKLNSYIHMEIEYGQLQDDMKRNQPDRESLKRCSFQFKTLQPQLMKLLSDSKQDSQKISSKTCKESDKSMMKTRIKLLSIRQKKLKALFDKHCRVQSILRSMKSKLGAEDTMNFTQASFSQSTTSSKNSKLYIPNSQTTHQSTILTKASQTKVLNSETGLFESGGQKIPITQRVRPEAMAQMVSNVEIQSKSVSAAMSNFVKTSSNRNGPPRQANAITFVSVPSSTDTTLKPTGNPPKTPGNQSQKIFFIPVGKASICQNQNTATNASLNFNEQNEERRRSKILITQKFVPPTKPIFVRVDNTGSKGASATSDMESTNSISRNNINNKPSIPILVQKRGISTPAPQGTYHQGTIPSSNEDEILDIILKSLDKDANESKVPVPVPVNSSYPVPQSLSSPYQDDSDSNGFEVDDEIVDLTKEGEIVSNMDEPQTKMTRLDRITPFSGTDPIQQSTVQENSANVNIVKNPRVKPSAAEMKGLEELGRPTIKSSKRRANNQVPTKTPVKKSPFHSPCRSVMSFTSGFSTSSTRYIMKMKQKALKINQAKTVRDFQTAMGKSPNSKKFKKFPSLKRMIDKGLLTPGKNKLSIIRQGKRVTASLLNSGLILDANGQGFSTATKWFSALAGTHLTMKAKAYRMVCYENTPLMDFKKQYDKLEFNNASSRTHFVTDLKEQSNEASSVHVVTSSSQTRSNTAPVIGPSTITTTPQFKTAFQISTNTATMPVRYQMTLPRPINPQYSYQIPNQVRYSIRTPLSVPRNLIHATNIGSPLRRSLIGNQRVLDQRNRLIQTGSISVDQSKTGDDGSLIRPIDPQSLLNEEIRSMLMKSVNVLLVSDSELMYYPDITEDFWMKPFKDVDISKELWKEVDTW